MRTTLKIDMDKRCAECGELGATGSGICLTCAAKAISGKATNSPIGQAMQRRWERIAAGKQPGGRMQAAIRKAAEDLETLLLNHEEEISGAYLAADEDLGVQINSTIKIGPGPSIGAHIVTTKINFVESRVKDETSQVVDPNQMKLDLEKTK